MYNGHTWVSQSFCRFSHFSLLQISKTLASFLFSVLCSASLLLLSLFFFLFFSLTSHISFFFPFPHMLKKSLTRLSSINPSDLLYAFSSHASLHLFPTTTMASHVFATRPCSSLPVERGLPSLL